MELIDQHTKKIMEGCKERARAAGLSFTDDSLEYIVSNQDLLELTPKGMIPTLYDYWVHDLEVIKSKKEYELYPHNPYETVINSRPPLSFYNSDNPDWLNVMIFYHVLGHIDFMQNNCHFRHTWDDDFVGRALADKRLLSKLRTIHGRWVDYVIEFARGIDNVVGYYEELGSHSDPDKEKPVGRLDYFFDIFLQKVQAVSIPEYLKEIDHYNDVLKDNPEQAEAVFLTEIKNKRPEFEAHYDKYVEEFKPRPKDLLQYLMRHSEFLNRDENQWMKTVMEVVRDTSLYFAPQIRTKILNEGWATYWHYELFLDDDRIKGHEADFARTNAFVTSVPKVGFNPYAVGWRLFQHVEDMANKGRLTYEFEKVQSIKARQDYDLKTGKGRDFILKVRKHMTDFEFVNTFVDQDFVDRFKLVLVGRRVNPQRRTMEYYIKSKKADDYKDMVVSRLAHPPKLSVCPERTVGGLLYIVHHYEGKQLVPEFVDNVLLGIEYLWGGPVELETHLIKKGKPEQLVYSVKNREVTTRK